MRSPSLIGSIPRRYSSLGVDEASPVRMARASVRSISTGVRLATSESRSTRLAPWATPITRPTRPRSFMTGLPTSMPFSLPASARRVSAKGPCESRITWAEAMGIGGLVLNPSRAR